MNRYNSIVPSQMTNRELRAICGDIQIAKNWNQDTATVLVKVNTNEYQEYEVDVKRHKDYQDAYRTETGALKLNGKPNI